MRADGKVVKNVDPMYTLAPYFMRYRYDAQNMITVHVPYENVHNYVLDARKRGYQFSHMTVMLAAYLRMITEFPELNRFVSNSKIYAHNTFRVGMVVLRPDGSDPSMSKMQFDLANTIFEVNDIITKYVEENNKADSDNASDKLFRKILKFPALVRIGMWMFRKMDKHGILPRAICDLSPFHTSMVFTNLASIGTNHIYHHVYDFGTTSIIMAMGKLVDMPVKEKGEFIMKRMIPLGVVMDERIGSGALYAKAFARLEYYLKHPEMLEKEPENIKVDYEFAGLSRRFAIEKKEK